MKVFMVSPWDVNDHFKIQVNFVTGLKFYSSFIITCVFLVINGISGYVKNAVLDMYIINYKT